MYARPHPNSPFTYLHPPPAGARAAARCTPPSTPTPLRCESPCPRRRAARSGAAWWTQTWRRQRTTRPAATQVGPRRGCHGGWGREGFVCSGWLLTAPYRAVQSPPATPSIGHSCSLHNPAPPPLPLRRRGPGVWRPGLLQHPADRQGCLRMQLSSPAREACEPPPRVPMPVGAM